LRTVSIIPGMETRAGADGDEERTLGIAEPQPRVVLELLERVAHLRPHAVGERAPRPVVRRPRLGGDREARRHGNAEVGHLGELAALAAEKVAHDGRAFRLA